MEHGFLTMQEIITIDKVINNIVKNRENGHNNISSANALESSQDAHEEYLRDTKTTTHLSKPAHNFTTE